MAQICVDLKNPRNLRPIHCDSNSKFKIQDSRFKIQNLKNSSAISFTAFPIAKHAVAAGDGAFNT